MPLSIAVIAGARVSRAGRQCAQHRRTNGQPPRVLVRVVRRAVPGDGRLCGRSEHLERRRRPLHPRLRQQRDVLEHDTHRRTRADHELVSSCPRTRHRLHHTGRRPDASADVTHANGQLRDHDHRRHAIHPAAVRQLHEQDHVRAANQIQIRVTDYRRVSH